MARLKTFSFLGTGACAHHRQNTNEIEGGQILADREESEAR